MARPTLTPAGYRRVTLVALVALVAIVITGGAVRLSGSGLGCPDWPNCADGRLVAPLEYHAMVEFVNRTVTGVVSLMVIVAVLGSLVRRPRRRDLTRLSLGLVAGVVGQIVLGGLTVLFELRPPFVMAHFLLSMVIVANAVVLHWRAGQPDALAPARPLDPSVRRLSALMVGATAMVVLLGTVVTAAGPHGGDEETPRLDVPVGEVARLHGLAVVLLVAIVATLLVLVHRTRAPAGVAGRGRLVLAVLLAQAAVGYVQYFTGVPVVLVGVHIAGATAAWAVAVRFHLGLGGAGAPAASGRPADEAVLARA